MFRMLVCLGIAITAGMVWCIAEGPDLFSSPTDPPPDELLTHFYFLPTAARGYIPDPGISPVYMPAVQVSKRTMRGVGATVIDCAAIETVGAAWAYNWGPNPAQCAGVEAVPMVWDRSQVDMAIGGDSPYGLLFNECDNPAQCNLAANVAADVAQQLVERNPARLWISPSAVNLWWLVDFMAAYNGPGLAGIAVHCWGVDSCKRYVNDARALADRYGVPEVWVTEFTVRNPADVAELVTWFNGRVERYAWYQLRTRAVDRRDTSLVDAAGRLTVWGNVYK